MKTLQEVARDIPRYDDLQVLRWLLPIWQYVLETVIEGSMKFDREWQIQRQYL